LHRVLDDVENIPYDVTEAPDTNAVDTSSDTTFAEYRFANSLQPAGLPFAATKVKEAYTLP